MGQETNDFWDDPAKDYRQRYELPDQFIWDIDSQPRIEWDGYMSIVAELLPPAPLEVLDVGCGPGMGAKLLSQRGYVVEGIDYNERAIEFAKLLVPEAHFIVDDIRRLDVIPELQDRFDAAILVEVFEHIPPQHHNDVLLALQYVLVPHGVVILSVPSYRLPPNKWDYQRFSLDEIEAIVSQNGYYVTKAIFQGMSPLFAPLVWKLLSNKFYDLRVARRALRFIYLKWFNKVRSPDFAGRYILRLEKSG